MYLINNNPIIVLNIINHSSKLRSWHSMIKNYNCITYYITYYYIKLYS